MITRKPILGIVILGAFVFGAFCLWGLQLSCQEHELPHESHQAALTDDPPIGPATLVDERLPVQEWKGLRAEATLRSLWPASIDTHALDIRLTNTESAPKKYVSIEAVTLGRQVTHFRRPPLATLWRRGSSVDYPRVASWEIRRPPAVRQPLEVVVRYQGAGAGVIVTFHWEVWIGPAEGG
jgi:hypothetical protein